MPISFQKIFFEIFGPLTLFGGSKVPRPPPWVHILTWFDLAGNFHLDEVDSGDFISEIFWSFGPIWRVKRATPTPMGLNFNLFDLTFAILTQN